MGWRLAADGVMVFHLAFVAFVVVGGFLAWRWRRLACLHLPIALYGVLIEVIGFTCPLTPLEKSLRGRAGSVGYEGGFVEHYVVPVLYPGDFTPATKFALAGLLFVTTLVAYAVWWTRATSSPSRAHL